MRRFVFAAIAFDVLLGVGSLSIAGEGREAEEPPPRLTYYHATAEGCVVYDAVAEGVWRYGGVADGAACEGGRRRGGFDF